MNSSTTRRSLVDTDEAIRRGRIKVDQSKRAAWLEAVAFNACTATESKVGSSDWMQGQVAAGADCLVDEECVSGVCDFSRCDPNQGCCQGVCMDIPSGSCLWSSHCGVGMYCDRGDSTLGTCRARLKAGDSCITGDECPYTTECVGAPGVRTCVPFAAAGEACNEDSGEINPQCDHLGSYCDRADHRCKPLRKMGQTCTGLDCVRDAGCLNGVCTPRAAAGGPCAYSPDEGVSCLNGSCEDEVCIAPIITSCYATLDAL